MTTMISEQEFTAFKDYMRLMLRDISEAKVGPYAANPEMQEIALVWSPQEGQKIEGFPSPDNVTHIQTDPYLNALPGDKYVFKSALYQVFADAGYKECSTHFISEMKQGEVECKMHSGCEPKYPTPHGDYPGVIYALFIRSTKDLKQAQGHFAAAALSDLTRTCRTAMNKHHVYLNPAASQAKPAP